jgi:hypothetical protein
VHRRRLSSFFRMTTVGTVVGLVLLGGNTPAAAQSLLTVHPGPAFSGTSGYISPSFNQAQGTSKPEASWALLNNAGTATWLSDFIPSSADSYVLRYNPPTGGPAQLGDLAGPPITPTSRPYAINAAGAIVGQSRDANGHDRPVRWNAGGTSPMVLAPLEHHPILGPPEGQANDINDSGSAVGWSGKTHPTLLVDVGDRAVRWDAAGNASELGNISAYIAGSGAESYAVATSEAYALNNAGTAVGYGTVYDAAGASKGNRAVRWNAAGVATELGHLGTGNTSFTNAAAWAVNEAGHAVGYAIKFDSEGRNDGQRAVRWNAGVTTAIELQVLGTDPDGSTFSKAYMLNDVGTAVGWLDKYNVQGVDQGARAVVWNSAGQVSELGLLPGASSSKAFDINNLSVTVGSMEAATTTAAVYWNAAGSPVDLNTLIAANSGWRLEHALAISDTGWVAGIGKYDDGPGGSPTPYDRVFMLQVPIAVHLPGDYNASGKVDAADYVAWRDKLGTTASLPNDTTPGWVLPADYSVWRANFGRVAGAGAAVGVVAVPEPSMLILAALGAVTVLASHRVRHSTSAA